jgi:hypothetical protein
MSILFMVATPPRENRPQWRPRSSAVTSRDRLAYEPCIFLLT